MCKTKEEATQQSRFQTHSNNNNNIKVYLHNSKTASRVLSFCYCFRNRFKRRRTIRLSNHFARMFEKNAQLIDMYMCLYTSMRCLCFSTSRPGTPEHNANNQRMSAALPVTTTATGKRPGTNATLSITHIAEDFEDSSLSYQQTKS